MTRLFDQTRDRLLQAAAGGATNRDAAHMTGIDESTLYAWLADTKPKFQEFQEAYATAKAASRFRSIRLIADSDDWRAHAWLLERIDPKHWGKAELDPAHLEARLAAYLQGHADATTPRLPTPPSTQQS